MKSLNELKEDKKGLMEVVNIVLALVLIVVVGAIGIFIADTTLTATALTTTSVAASGNLTITGNPNCGGTVNITNASGTKVAFYLNTTPGCTPPSADFYQLNISVNTSTGTANNLTTAINANVTLNGTITAANPTAGVVTLTYKSTGTAGNAVATVETMTNASWINGATLTGGINASSVATMQTNILSAGDTGSSFVVILIIASIGGLAIAYLLGMVGRKREGM